MRFPNTVSWTVALYLTHIFRLRVFDATVSSSCWPTREMSHPGEEAALGSVSRRYEVEVSQSVVSEEEQIKYCCSDRGNHWKFSINLQYTINKGCDTAKEVFFNF